MSKIAFLFPGQGAQTVGMGQQLYETLPAARALYDRAREVLGYDLAKICFEGPAEELDSTIYSQPALFVTSLAALEQLRANSPDVVLACEAAAGLSLGEDARARHLDQPAVLFQRFVATERLRRQHRGAGAMLRIAHRAVTDQRDAGRACGARECLRHRVACRILPLRPAT